jgi:hypothetical protein
MGIVELCVKPPMKKIYKTLDQGLIVRPRWPHNYVLVSERAYSQLIAADSLLLKHNVRLVLTRGFEHQNAIFNRLHAVARIIGAVLFLCLYPGRKNECREIFSANGHDKKGDCVDVSIIYNGKDMHLLPFGVYTGTHTINRLKESYGPTVNLVWQTLKSFGFSIHPNSTEAMQIHCELEPSREIA